ncbi:uncharacterized protein LOC128883650 [Hylaeus volcanicus]|uniref:uncharacterized protein LOC128883650 n=1 Tax=Hylaeus volcanicus TaxID=313075 RepID=UPI0023B82AD3|nr:uncharacterized protein LOC128883650 [Hylaeus volcanicus]XP_053992204.1 uncharacterized protein LOC128883650 [Hylaeus volcanicus]
MSMDSSSNMIFGGFFVVCLFHWFFSFISLQAQNKLEKGNSPTTTENNEKEKKYTPKEGSFLKENNKINFENLSKQSVNLRKRNFCEPINIHDMDLKTSNSEVLRDHSKRHSPDTPMINRCVSPKQSNKQEGEKYSEGLNEKQFSKMTADSVFSRNQKYKINIHDNANLFISKDNYFTNSSILKNSFIDNTMKEETIGSLQNIAAPALDKVDNDFETITDTIKKNVEFTNHGSVLNQSTETAEEVQLESTISLHSNKLKDTQQVLKGLENIKRPPYHSTSLNSSEESLNDLTDEDINKTRSSNHSLDDSNEKLMDPNKKIEKSLNTDISYVSSFTNKREISKKTFGGTFNDNLLNSYFSGNKTLDNHDELIDTIELAQQPLPPSSFVSHNATDSYVHETHVKCVITNEEGVKKTTTNEVTVNVTTNKDETSMSAVTITDEKTDKVTVVNDIEPVKVVKISKSRTVERVAENDDYGVKVEISKDKRSVERLEDNNEEVVKVKTVTYEKTVNITATSVPVQRCVTTSVDEFDNSVFASESISRSELSDSGTSYQVATDQDVSEIPINNIESPEPVSQNLEERTQSKECIGTFCDKHPEFECFARDKNFDDKFTNCFSRGQTRHPNVGTFDLVYEAEIGDENTYKNIKICEETTGSVGGYVDQEVEGNMSTKIQDISMQSKVTPITSNNNDDDTSILKPSKNFTFSEDEKNLDSTENHYPFNSILSESVMKMVDVSNDAQGSIKEHSPKKIRCDHDSKGQLRMNSDDDSWTISQTEKHTGTNVAMNTKHRNPEESKICHNSTSLFDSVQKNTIELSQPLSTGDSHENSPSPDNSSRIKNDTQVLQDISQNTSDAQNMKKDSKDEEEESVQLLHRIKKRAIKRLNRVMSSTQEETNDPKSKNSSFNHFSLDDESTESFDTEEHDEDDTGNNDFYFKEDVHLAKNLKTEGNELLKDQAYREAAIKYTEALKYSGGLEFSGILLCNRAACYLLLKYYKQVIKDCNDGLLLFPSYVKLYLRRFRAYEGLKKWHEALADLDKVLELNPSLSDLYKDLHGKIKNLSELQFEKEKEEMINNLKGFGNWALGKIGLSIDNFKIDKNEATGAYNVSFQNSTS